MGDREVPAPNSRLLGQRERGACDPKDWGSAVGALDPYVVEAERPETESKRLHHRLASREPTGERWNLVDLGRHIIEFALREQTRSHRRRPRERRTKPLDIHDVDSDSDDPHRSVPPVIGGFRDRTDQQLLDREILEACIVETALGLSDPVDQAVVSAVVALEHATHHSGGELIM